MAAWWLRYEQSKPPAIVMHRTKLPLTIWFWAIYLCATDKRGISAVLLIRTLGICYDSVWHLLDRTRTAMGQRDENYPLCGIVELDDGYVGGNSHNGRRGRGTDKQKIVVVLSKSTNVATPYTWMKAYLFFVLLVVVQRYVVYSPNGKGFPWGKLL